MQADSSNSDVGMTASPGWEARLDLLYGLRSNVTCAEKTQLLRKQQFGPLTVQRAFYPEGATCHSYILHPPGGVAGGDSLQINVDAQAGAQSLLTTPGATKFYRAAGQRFATVAQTICIADEAIVEWLPQQNIFFPGANATLVTTIEIASRGKYVGWEINCLGRPANGEPFANGCLRSAIRVSIGGELRLADRLHIDRARVLNAASGLRGYAVQGSLIAAPCTEEQRDALEQILHTSNGMTYGGPVGLTVVDEVLIARALGEHAESLQQLFTQLWGILRQHWLLKAPCPPRIWST
jgi:urease accessory protein